MELKAQGIDKLYPPQEDAIKAGALAGRNLVLATPTASGKTLIAVLCGMQHILEKNGKVLYLTPLRALASEKYEDFLRFTGIEKRNGNKISVAISTGDYDSSSPWLARYDVIVTTNEKCDSLLRHRAPWLTQISLLVLDEIHLIGSDRGPTVEVVVSRIRQVNPSVQILALSATVRNAGEVADWLEGEAVLTDWRPVELREGVCQKETIIYRDGRSCNLKTIDKEVPLNLALNTIESDGQALVFVESRRRTMSMARELGEVLEKRLSRRQLQQLRGLADQVLYHGERTSISIALSDCMSKGTAFHHAGLGSDHRRIIESSFREGLLKSIVATPTLASGVNLPARLVVIANYRRFIPGYGMYPIPVMEYKQMSGRAGRPQYDEFGEAVLVADSSEEQDYLMETYVLSKPERLYSRLASEAALRTHVLAAISSEYAHSEEGLLQFFARTFYAYHYDTSNLRDTVGSMLRFFLKERMIVSEDRYIRATEFGRRVSQLYVDPLTAIVLRDGLDRMPDIRTDFTLLHLICHCPDTSPMLRPRRDELQSTAAFLDQHREELTCRVPDEWEDPEEYEQFLGEVKTALVLQSWIEEWSENDILEKYSAQPGDRYSLVQNADWLLYASEEIVSVFKIKGLRGPLSVLRERVRHGVKKELVPLVGLRGIGRIRGRVLYNSGLRTLSDLKKAPIQKLAAIPLIGPSMAKRIKEQVGGTIDEADWKEVGEMERSQTALTEFVEEEPAEEPSDEDHRKPKDNDSLVDGEACLS